MLRSENWATDYNVKGWTELLLAFLLLTILFKLNCFRTIPQSVTGLIHVMLEINFVFVLVFAQVFFYAIIGLSSNFFLLLCQRCRFLAYEYRAEDRIFYPAWRPFSWVVGGLFFFSVLTWLNFVLRVKGCSRVSLLPNRQSSYFFLFLGWQKFQAEIHVAFNYEQP